MARPWRTLEMPGKRFGVFRLGESRSGVTGGQRW
jgi:hypothetical protein